jgi:hypothetical protein
MKVVVNITQHNSNPAYISAERSMRRYRRHTLVLSLCAVACIVGMIVAIAFNGDVAIVTLFTLGPLAAAFAFVAGISYFSGVRDARKTMKSIGGHGSNGATASDDASSGELRGDIALYVSLSAMCAYSLYVLGSATVHDLSTADLRYVAGVATYVATIAFFAAIAVIALVKNVKYLRMTFGYLRKSSE